VPLNPSQIKKILVVSLTNIGDVILTLPVIDILLCDFPHAQHSLVIGPKAASLFQGHPRLKKIYIYDKHQPPFQTMYWMMELLRERFDLVIDLRNSAIPYLIFPRYRTPAEHIKKWDLHMRDKHLNRLKTVYPFISLSKERHALFIREEDRAYIKNLIANEIGEHQPYVVIAPGAAHPSKRWHAQGFIQLAERLAKSYKVKIALVGDEKDYAVSEQIHKSMSSPAVNLAGRTTLIQLAQLMNGASLVVSNDSAPMHLASYLNIPVLAIFGKASDPVRYGPWSEVSHFLQSSSQQKEEERSIESVSAASVFQCVQFDGKRFFFRR